MSNSWFEFREFTVHQDRTAMKVGTDGVLLGAWADCSSCSNIDKKILDIGTGTGLVGLMMAQRSLASIAAIELDPDACSQAADNFSLSPWADRMVAIQADFRAYYQTSTEQFDLIVSNPPFFSQSLQAPSRERNMARHDEKLSLNEIVDGVSRLLNPMGKVSLILPYSRFEEVCSLFKEKRFGLIRQTSVRSFEGGEIIRVLGEWGEQSGKSEADELVIYEDNPKQYTKTFKKLTDKFYLNL